MGKNSWNNACLQHKANGNPSLYQVQSIIWKILRIWSHVAGTTGWDIYIPVYWINGAHCDLSEKGLRTSLKWTVEYLNCLKDRGIPINHNYMYSLYMGVTNTIVLIGYSGTQIQRMGH